MNHSALVGLEKGVVRLVPHQEMWARLFEGDAQYAHLKTELAQRYPNDRNAYLDGKAPFIEKVLRLARQAGSLSMVSPFNS